MDELLLEQIKKQVLPLLEGERIELVDLLIRRERARLTLRFLVDKPGGITLDECARVNRRISQILDQENIVQESYILEVASPGLDRPLLGSRDFKRSLGKLVKIVLHKPQNRQNVWIGFMDNVDDENVIIQTEKQEKLCIPRANIARANLEVRL